MRWIYYNANCPQERAHHEQVVQRIDAWWHEFEACTGRLNDLFSRHAEWDLPAWMAQHLQAIHPALRWEFGPALECDGHRLVVTPESDSHLRPLAASIIDRAPQLDGWEFYPYRVAEDVAMAQQTVAARTSGNLDGVVVRPAIGEHHRIDLVYHSPRTADAEDEQAWSDAFVATETLLGEECLDKWIGSIQVAPLENNGKSAQTLIPLQRLKGTVDALISSIREQLPAAPHFRWADDAQWTGFELQPEQQDDYAQQYDMFVGTSPNQALWIAAHAGPSFYSERFTRCGETFCYVKLDGAEGLDEQRFADKSAIEDALDSALRPAGLGGTIGGGTGLRYSYVDLALVELDRGIDVVRRVLAEGNTPRRTWVQFFDADLAGEWVGIYDDSPPPPMELDER